MKIHRILTVLALLLPAELWAQSATCPPTPDMHSGAHYVANAATLNHKPGKGLVIEGIVKSATTCKPLGDAVVEIWQAGDEGTYLPHLRVFTITHPDGKYRFETEWPDMPIPHIHFKVSAEAHRKLTTQWIPDDKTDHAIFDLVLKPMAGY